MFFIYTLLDTPNMEGIFLLVKNTLGPPPEIFTACAFAAAVFSVKVFSLRRPR